MNVLFLDDCPRRQAWAKEEFEVPGNYFAAAETAESATDWLAWAEPDNPDGPEFFDVVYLDHDLDEVGGASGSGRNTGMEVVYWVIENKPKVGEFVVHSLNERMAKAMVVALKKAGYKAKYVSFLRLCGFYE